MHCYIKTYRQLTSIDVEDTIRDIIHNKFNDLLKIECHLSNNEICDWNIKYNDIHGFNVVLKDSNQLIFGHPDNSWDYWAQLVIENELSIKYCGKILDEEYPKQELKPIFEYPTFKTYLDTAMKHSKQWKQALIAIELSWLPEELKNL